MKKEIIVYSISDSLGGDFAEVAVCSDSPVPRYYF